MSTNSWPKAAFPDGITWCCCILWFSVWFNLPFIWCKSRLCDWQKAFIITELLPCLRLMCYRGFQHIHQHFTAHRPYYLTERSPTWIHQSKGLYSTALLCKSFAALAHMSLLSLFCFFSSCLLTAIMQYKLTSQSLLFTGNAETFFSCAISVRAVNLLSCELLTPMKLSPALVVAFGLICPRFVIFLSRFLKTPKSIIHCSPGNFYVLGNLSAWLSFFF